MEILHIIQPRKYIFYLFNNKQEEKHVG